MKDGVIQQVGKPMELYDHPVNQFVAGFIGSPQMNFFDVTVSGVGEIQRWKYDNSVGRNAEETERTSGRHGVRHPRRGYQAGCAEPGPEQRQQAARRYH